MDVKLASIAEAWVDALDPTIVVDRDIYLEALQQDPVALGHNIVRLVRTSSLHCEAFDNCYNFFPLSRLFPRLRSMMSLLLLCSLLPRD